MRRVTKRNAALLAAFGVLCLLFAPIQATLTNKPTAGSYHEKFMAHVESSLAKLNDTLHDWKERGLAHEYIGSVAASSVDVLTHLDDLVSSPTSTTQRRHLSQIYDEASQRAAEERLASVTADAEARYAQAVTLLQDAAQKAIQNNTEDLMARLADKLRTNNVLTSGKIISDQLQALELADQVTELARGLVPEYDGGDSKGLVDSLTGALGNVFDGSLINRLRPGRDTAEGAGSPAPEVVETDDSVVITAKEPTPETVDGVPLGAVGEPVQVSTSVTVTPLERAEGEEGKRAAGAPAPEVAAAPKLPLDPSLNGEVSRADFYKEANEVFDRFDEEGKVSEQANVMRRSLRAARRSSIDANALIQKVESSMDALRSMRERGMAVSEDTATAIKARASAARKRLEDMKFAHGRHLFQDKVVDADSPTDSMDSDNSGFLTFPGETVQSLHDRIASDPDGIIDEETVSAMDETLIMMPMMPMMVSQEISFVFIPIDKATDAEELIESVADVVMSTIAEASMSMFMGLEMGEEVDLEMFDAYDASYELPDGQPPFGFGGVRMDTSSSYREPRSAIKKRRNLKSNAKMIDLASVNDSYELELYFNDPTWFNSAIVMDGDDDLAELSLAIRLSGPEDMGGLPPDVLMFIAESEALMDAMSTMLMPSYKVFDAVANEAVANAQRSDNFADAIVSRLQSTYGAYGQPARAQSLYSADPRGGVYSYSSFDFRWLGVMFGAVGIVLILAVGFITAFQNRSPAPGYVVIEDIQSVQPSKVVTAKPANRKTSNLPA